MGLGMHYSNEFCPCKERDLETHRLAGMKEAM